MTVSAPARQIMVNHDSHVLERVFEACFAAQYHTRLVGGAAEPLYMPGHSRRVDVSSPDDSRLDSILYYREDFYASALHEVAHWCIAGPERRLQVDFGYWYKPEDRDPVTQRQFEHVEAKPQALEWLFARACGYRFKLSFDNPDQAGLAGADGFAAAVMERAQTWQRFGLPTRANRFYSQLGEAFGQCRPVAELNLQLSELM